MLLSLSGVGIVDLDLSVILGWIYASASVSHFEYYEILKLIIFVSLIKKFQNIINTYIQIQRRLKVEKMSIIIQ